MAPTDFLGQLDAASRAELLGRARIRRLKKGDFVFRVGDDGDTVFLLLHGRAKTYKLSPEGREVILWFCFPGELFGMAAHPHHKGRMVTVQACEESEVAELPNAAFQTFLESRPEVSRICLQAVAFRLGMLANRLVYLMVDNATARIAKLLMDLAVRYGDENKPGAGVPLTLTHQEIADITGVRRQTVTRILGEFTASGALTVRYRKISIRDPDRLAAYATRRPDF